MAIIEFLRLAVLFACFCLPILSTATGGAEAPAPLTLAVHPYLPQTEILQRFRPLTHYLEERIGRRIQLRIGRDYEDHLTHIGKGKVDIAFLGPAIYVRAVDRFGPFPLLARLEVLQHPEFRGALITRADSGITDLTSLLGRSFAFGDAKSTMSHLVPRYVLLASGVKLDDLEHYGYLGSHTNVALAVLSGDYDAGAVKEEVYQDYRSKGLRLLTWTPAVSEHLFISRQDLPEHLLKKLRQAMHSIHQSASGRSILQKIKSGATSLQPVRDTDYDPLRRMLTALRETRS